MVFEAVPFDEATMILGLVEIIKKIDKDKKLDGFYPVFAIGFGLIISIASAFAGETTTMQAIFNGIGFGLIASGLYSGVKAVRG